MRSITPAVLAMLIAATAGCREPRDLAFHWGERIVCSQAIDDHMTHVRWDRVDDEMAVAETDGAVLAFHAHIPDITVSRDAIAHLLELAELHHLATLTFRDLSADRTPRAAIALAFDDDTPDAWSTLVELLAAHHARVTFFVTHWQTMSAAEHAELRRLAYGGHDIEPHGANHVHAPAYARDHGMTGYLVDEVLPSLAALRDDGFPPPTTFAYPFGEHSAELDAVLLGFFPLLRVTASHCPRSS